jgi:hypothetical protein
VSGVHLAHLREEPRDEYRRERVGLLLGVRGVLARVEGILIGLVWIMVRNRILFRIIPR